MKNRLKSGDHVSSYTVGAMAASLSRVCRMRCDVHGLVTTVNGLARPVAAILYKLANSNVAISNDNSAGNCGQCNRGRAARDATYTSMISYEFYLFSIALWQFLCRRKSPRSATQAPRQCELHHREPSLSLSREFRHIRPGIHTRHLKGGGQQPGIA
ncbi:hypothetical protein H310_11385 [Aphanomyces invadans]|uniref:Uncharacterized protein n=1 Tax=Aphanomyces invadans TaxID=157072 RepID=A0A024TP17_9STRA|nr:hypothetical protein H310_11385 [Aphanomyces invadans]ETV95102.1 hypothetical protein H310_11385 [Aphanomyces invadans]|eukprot:XP_008876275.1 hypothetical protein H310_11385 [Aphanomyces invadans]